MEAECFWRAGKSHEQVSAKNERGYKKERQGQAVIIWTGNHGWNATDECQNNNIGVDTNYLGTT